MGMRTFARQVAHNASYMRCHSEAMFYTNFHTLWIAPRERREKGMKDGRKLKIARRH